ncbi:hypothetical protein PROPHIGD54-2_72 [Mycobacterium phage prophiGD54-2]|uniref:hypothetical protein n=1 Tax=Mycobacteroides abscessus TaxID=36809 RepID=UPI0019D05F76|nr:hypothetical protein [Mycobacteroides abscessus]QSM04672.1 hypothetical protein PROPHIGD54-2_72 [Mycobacterium phage prophiGD54-2]QSN19631.1 hypothetical protein I3U41_17130 [Mycobacteroides abscessus subsp. abscessus]
MTEFEALDAELRAFVKPRPNFIQQLEAMLSMSIIPWQRQLMRQLAQLGMPYLPIE